MPGPYEPAGVVAFVCPERVGGAVRARRWPAVRAPRFRRPRTEARPARTGSPGALRPSPVTLLLQVKCGAFGAAVPARTEPSHDANGQHGGFTAYLNVTESSSYL